MRNQIIKILEQNHVVFESKENMILIKYNIHRNLGNCIEDIEFKEKRLVFTARIFDCVPEVKYVSVSQLVNQLNLTADLGHFELDTNYGDLCYRLNVVTELNLNYSDAMLKRLIFTPLTMFVKYADKIAQTITYQQSS